MFLFGYLFSFKLRYVFSYGRPSRQLFVELFLVIVLYTKLKILPSFSDHSRDCVLCCV